MAPGILLAIRPVEDGAPVRLGIRDHLAARGCTVFECDTWRAAETILAGGSIDAAIVDCLLPDGNAVDRMPRLRSAAPHAPVVILTGHGSIDLAIRAMNDGAESFLIKPVDLDAMWRVLRRELENARIRRNELATKAARVRNAIDPFLGTSAAIRELAERARLVAASGEPVLIHGETGSGKGALARWLHDHGLRAGEPFVEEPLETTHRGTWFLAEIGDAGAARQSRVLQVLEEKPFARMGLIAASRHDLRALVAEGRLREELYVRINTSLLRMPPLRERTEDIPPLASLVLRRLGASAFVDREVAAALQRHSWPGNIRELRNVLERAVLLSQGGGISAAHLQFDRAAPEREPDTGDLTLEELVRLHVERALAAEHGRVERAALRLGIARSSLYHRIRRYGIDLSRF